MGNTVRLNGQPPPVPGRKGMGTVAETKEIFMSYKATIFACALLAVSMAYAAEEEVRVLVFSSGTKPAAALQNPTYETRKTSGKDDMALMCKDCMKKVVEQGTKPAIKVESKKCEAFLCSHCGHMVWRDNGHEHTFKDKADVEAMEKIETALKKFDTTTKPAAQALK
jgi:hypothetical protein